MCILLTVGPVNEYSGSCKSIFRVLFGSIKFLLPKLFPLLFYGVVWMCEALDILRMMLLHPQCATYFAKDAGDGKGIFLSYVPFL
jgi:hypothetical protein